MEIQPSQKNTCPIHFKGKVYYTNKTARKYAKEYRNIIHTLKHHTSNNALEHFISLNFYNKNKFVVFRLNTQYKHPYKIGGTDIHSHEITYVGDSLKKGIGYIQENLPAIKDWKREIDLTQHHDAQHKVIHKSKKSQNNIFDKIKNFFTKNQWHFS